MQPLVSILTPSFNQERWLHNNLISVNNQTYPDIEHIVMDGGSTDGSVGILQASSYPNLQWRSEPDRGQADALNKAFAVSRGDIIGWINSDDAYVDCRSVATVVRCFEKNPSVGIVYGHSILVNGDDEVLQVLWAPARNQWLRRYLTVFYQPSVFVRRDLIDGQFVDESLHYVMDSDLWRRLYSKDVNMMRVDLIVSLDRHQEFRKVRQAGFRTEVIAYTVERGIPVYSIKHKLIRRVATMCFRLRGIPTAFTAPNSVAAATRLVWPSTRTRIFRQIAVPRSRMPLHSE